MGEKACCRFSQESKASKTEKELVEDPVKKHHNSGSSKPSYDWQKDVKHRRESPTTKKPKRNTFRQI
jgi:hypothetical protein